LNERVTRSDPSELILRPQTALNPVNGYDEVKQTHAPFWTGTAPDVQYTQTPKNTVPVEGESARLNVVLLPPRDQLPVFAVLVSVGVPDQLRATCDASPP
jgi:hypothetical protein